MQITLLKTTDPRNKLKKTVTTVADYATATIKDNCNIMRPVVILPNSSDVFTANYMYISAFGRYYFIDNIETEHNRLFIQGSVDVLMSYRAEIREMYAYIERSETLRNLYMNDKMFRVQNNRKIDIQLFENAADNFTQNGEFILVVAGPAELPAKKGGD